MVVNAMRGIAARVIQQLAGHSELTTTQRYMHLSPGASEAAIAMLETPPPRRDAPARGDMLETASRRPRTLPNFNDLPSAPHGLLSLA